MEMKASQFTILLLFLVTPEVTARTVRVEGATGDQFSNTESVLSAVQEASAGDTVFLERGRHALPFAYGLTLDRPIVLKGERADQSILQLSTRLWIISNDVVVEDLCLIADSNPVVQSFWGLSEGIVIRDASPTIRRCLILAGTAVEVEGNSAPVLRYNDWSFSPQGYVIARDGAVVDARWNWWGRHVDGRLEQRVSGSVDIYPVLESPGAVLGDSTEGDPGNGFTNGEVRTPSGTKHTMVLVPGASYEKGSDLGQVGGYNNPVVTVAVASFFIDKFEVTRRHYEHFATATGRQLPGSAGAFEDHERSDFPMSDVAWIDAQSYCQWAGMRLPTDAEWELAARGTDGRLYPWGNDFPSDAANYAGSTPQKVGAFPRGRSPYGALDMAGNVAEWVSDEEGLVRGGSYADNLFGIMSALAKSRRNFPGPDVGFRCATEIDVPTSASETSWGRLKHDIK